MKTFHDRNGKVWNLSITIGAIKRCQELCQINPMELVLEGSDLLKNLDENPALLANVLYGCCKPDIDAANLSDEQFGELLSADSLDEGLEALKAEVINFSPKHRRGLLEKVSEKQKTLQEKAVALAMLRIGSEDLDKRLEQALTARIDRDLQRILQENGIDNAGSSPGS